MNELTVDLIISYVLLSAIPASFGVMLYVVEEQKRRGARLILCAPVWPIALPAVFGRTIGRGIARLFKEATRR